MQRGVCSALTFLCVLCILRGEVSAHPVPKDNHDRTIVVRLTADAVIVEYRLELDVARAARDLQNVDLSDIQSEDQLYAVFTRYFGPILADNLVARVDGKPLTFTCTTRKHELLDHLRCDFVFRAPWKLEAGKVRTFAFRESNFDLEDFDRVSVAIEAGRGVRLSQVKAADKTLQDRAPIDRRPGDNEKLRRVAADVVLADTDLPGEYKPAHAPEGESRQPPGSQAARAKPAADEAAATVKSGPQAPDDAPAQRSESLLHLLFDTRHGMLVLLLIAAGLGAAHALTPGHGKTLVAAYLVGERGTVWHAVLLGVVVTVTHTGAVLALAGLGQAFPNALPTAIEAMELIVGLGIALLGLRLLLRRLSGRADHFHLPGRGHHHHHHHGDHHHDHTHEQVPDLGKGKVGLWPLVLLGISGGIVPCWDAIVILMVAVGAGRLAVALPLLVAFSAGLAAVLVGLGVSVVWARRWAGAVFGEEERLRRLVRLLPLASALVIMLMGLWMSYDSTHGAQLPTK